MVKLLLDTNIVIDVLNYKNRRHEWFVSLLSQYTVACCEVTVAEVYTGIKPLEELRAREFFANLEYLAIDFFAARLAGQLKNYYTRHGRSLSLADCLIAAAAIGGDYELVTQNLKDFPMPELKLYRG